MWRLGLLSLSLAQPVNFEGHVLHEMPECYTVTAESPPGGDYAWVTKSEVAELVGDELSAMSAIACGPLD